MSERTETLIFVFGNVLEIDRYWELLQNKGIGYHLKKEGMYWKQFPKWRNVLIYFFRIKEMHKTWFQNEGMYWIFLKWRNVLENLPK